MSGGTACSCAESREPVSVRRWIVIQRKCNHSAFSGYHRTPSAYSAIYCQCCGAIWRTKAAYVDQLPDGKL